MLKRMRKLSPPAGVETVPQDTKLPVSRRDVLKTAWVALGSLVALEAGGLTLAYMQPRLAEGEFGGQITAGLVDDFPPGSVTHIANARAYLSRLPDGGFLAIYQRCTHLGCSVPWDQSANAFTCPCHSSEFDPQGELLSPPAPRPLDIFPVVIEAGEVKIDTAAPVSRQSFEPAQVVYP
jgi:cytochrome b6-f complex iron-sulfur subunit